MMKLRFLQFAKILAVLTLAVGLSSCASKDKEGADATSGVKLTPNGSYRTASTSGPYLRNKDSGLPYDFSGNQSVSISSGPRSQKYIALTFDDGPNPQHTPRLLDMLKRRNVKATFYVVGRNVAAHPNIVRRTVAEGHEIGNHTWTHRNLKTLSDEMVSWELDKTRDAIISATGVQPRTMRPPYGAMYQNQREWVYRKYGYPTVLWDVDPLDWKKPAPSVVAQRLISGTKNGSILLVHDLHGQSVDAIPQTIDTLLRQGYQFVTVSQLVALRAAQGM
ncbi:Peptidoglycan/xylan/chitin deacetylase, PgdA/CDA1 family [Rubritalea squalenifaciens DSM 18772]|uniref:Peptidoglycan/xylan/chitin deacetylase, PgdA/CDA1 family n=1 Tax=Rubritalea squalenifaciens DSM 18772 TaxID=1123071 RepID=A0A1M6R9R6_9BACT|nr:polysaccharide deacetylase family protein [Rubritalea squalenifaciens]SHK29192.1 Peptidoglycan/xylan/chitin deacetylase, PgdA/CDA1 family [Rubritalea squalenifaciens DSM 18772]